MENTYSGSCLCGQVKYQIEGGGFDGFFLCHCTYCQKDTGSAHSSNLFSNTGKLKWLKGEDKVKTYNLPSTRHAKGFCIDCGSALPNLQQSQMIVIPAGSLDTKITLKPNAHIFYASKASWENDLESVVKFENFPP